MAKKPNRQPAPKAAPQPRQKESAPKEEGTAGNILWRLGILLCTALVIIALLFASVNGGSTIIGMPESSPNTTPTPPVSSVDPGQTITGSDATPIPPSPTVAPTDATVG